MHFPGPPDQIDGCLGIHTLDSSTVYKKDKSFITLGTLLNRSHPSSKLINFILVMSKQVFLGQQLS